MFKNLIGNLMRINRHSSTLFVKITRYNIYRICKEVLKVNLEKRIDLLEFQLDLLFENTDLSRFVYELKLTREQYQSIMNLMDDYRAKIEAGEKVDNGIFETEMYELVPEHNRDYHFCESITRLFAEAGRWTEVFPALYGQMPKYNGFNV